ncbi:ABC transporter permease subunit [Acuticoccus sp. MNP-M23]|uniref:ABC transporter permease n=1 Tax=Acuticoccus sp. MNP-M23 TaxID=3072793 RepID=UPI002816798B|nr:ABC transporter permease subunit [Acuticoccus sp. MNP-M23]WMS44597.1 ABC transporter permease subunit [Acuticoccus sp. MNP-M23]
MSIAATIAARPAPSARNNALFWCVALAVLAVIFVVAPNVPLLDDPRREFVIPFASWISDGMDFLVDDLSFGLFTFEDFTRGVAYVLSLPLAALTALLASGWTVPLTEVDIAPLPWFGLLLAMVFMGWRVGGTGLAVLMFACFAYLAVFDQWQSAMITLSSVLVAVPIGILVGLLLGILAYKHSASERVISPILDLMQTVPVFAYLLPVLVLFGFGQVSAMIATIIYAMPPMVRVTIVALRSVPGDLLEFGDMAGCTPRQMLWRIELPAARDSLMIGVNQVVMLSLNMVIIASMIGAGGLGRDVLTSLKRLAIGDALEAGVAITLLAIAIDRLCQALANRGRKAPRADRHGLLAVSTPLGVLVILGLGMLVAALFPALSIYPQALVLDTGPFWDELIRLINIHLYDTLDAIKAFLLIHVMIPVKRLLVEVPWLAVATGVALLGWRLSGLRLAAMLFCMSAFIAFTGNWEKAMVSVYLCGTSVVIACLIGIPIGIWSAASRRARKIISIGIDTLQTLPSFVYLIPVVMLFQVGDFSAMIAIVLYAIAPAVRYTDHGLRQVPTETIEAATMSGCTPSQILWRVKLPLATPQIMLGVNQTIMMALSMLVITALVGTSDLGQEVYIALTRADVGMGIVAGVSVAFIAMTADRLIGAWAAERRRKLHLS